MTSGDSSEPQDRDAGRPLHEAPAVVGERDRVSAFPQLGAPPARIIGGNAPRRARLAGLAWLILLAAPLSDAFTRTEPARMLGIAAIVGFALLYAGTFLTASPTTQVRDTYLVGMQIVLGGTLFVAYGDGWWQPLVFAGASAVFLLPWPAGIWVLAGLNVVGLVVGLAIGMTPEQLGDLVVSFALSSVVMISVARLVHVIRQLRIAQEALAQAAVAEERLRFSRDLHDLLGHSLSAIVVKSELASRILDVRPAQVAVELGDIERLARGALADVRETVAGYRDLSLAAELDGARAALAAGGVQCTVSPAEQALPARVEAVLAWGVREAATNVLRHAAARTCTIALRARDGVATLDVEDDGRGGSFANHDTDATVPGTGLAGLAERIAAVGGTLAAGPLAAGGFRLRAEVPLS